MKLLFKFKIALLSFAASGILLIIFGVSFFAYVYSSGLDRMDREIRALIEVPIRGNHPGSYWHHFGKSLQVIHGDDGEERIALIVLDQTEEVLYQSTKARPQLLKLPRPDLPPPPGNQVQQPQEDRPNAPPHEEMFMRRNDRNQDGKVERTEFDGPPQAFDAADANSDGFIDADESRSIPRPPQMNRQPPGGTRPAPLEQKNQNTTPPPAVSSFMTLDLTVESWRAGVFRTPDLTIIAALDMNSFNAEIDSLRNIFMVTVPLGLLILGLLGWLLAGRAMKPIAVIADTAAGITAKGLDKRIPMVGNDAELERLVNVSNTMLDRLEKSYHQAVRFSADAAHELQTPLTILQGELDNAIQYSENGSEEQQRYSMLLEETRNLKAVVQKLLLLAHADEGRLNINPQSIDLSELIENAAEDIEFMASNLDVKLKVQKPVALQADTALLNQVIRNMTSNAAKYASDHATAVFELILSGSEVQFTLSNHAPSIPDEDRLLLFERFHRVEKSRTAAGSGLGLSLAREIARAHGGELVLNPYADGMVSFTLSLPIT